MLTLNPLTVGERSDAFGRPDDWLKVTQSGKGRGRAGTQCLVVHLTPLPLSLQSFPSLW